MWPISLGPPSPASGICVIAMLIPTTGVLEPVHERGRKLVPNGDKPISMATLAKKSTRARFRLRSHSLDRCAASASRISGLIWLLANPRRRFRELGCFGCCRMISQMIEKTPATAGTAICAQSLILRSFLSVPAAGRIPKRKHSNPNECMNDMRRMNGVFAAGLRCRIEFFNDPR